MGRKGCGPPVIHGQAQGPLRGCGPQDNRTPAVCMQQKPAPRRLLCAHKHASLRSTIHARHAHAAYLAHAGGRCHTLGVWAGRMLRSDPWLQQQGSSAQTTTHTSQQATRLCCTCSTAAHVSMLHMCAPTCKQVPAWHLASCSSING
jgi:hypothetical protein